PPHPSTQGCVRRPREGGPWSRRGRCGPHRWKRQWRCKEESYLSAVSARPNRTRRSAVDGGERSGAVAAPVPAVLVTEGHLDGHVARLTGLPVTPAQPAL